VGRRGKPDCSSHWFTLGFWNGLDDEVPTTARLGLDKPGYVVYVDKPGY